MTFELSQKHDNLLLEILKDTKTPPNFLEAVFGFLSRRTDFYHIYNDETKIGLPPGMKNEIVNKVNSFLLKMLSDDHVKCNNCRNVG